jgi:hypothetical protein
MADRSRKLDKCCNGCDAPVHPPSRVLCVACFAALDRKMTAIGERVAAGIAPFPAPDATREVEAGPEPASPGEP